MNWSFIDRSPMSRMGEDRSACCRFPRLTSRFGWHFIYSFSFSILCCHFWLISSRQSPSVSSLSTRRWRHSRQPQVSDITFISSPSVFRLANRVDQSVRRSLRVHVRLIVDVLIEKKEFVVGPAITLVPQLFSLPHFLSSFIFNCQNLDSSWLRYFLIVSYWISFTPQWKSFFLYISPSSFYLSEWRKTNIKRWMNTRQLRRPASPTMTFTVLPNQRETTFSQWCSQFLLEGVSMSILIPVTWISQNTSFTALFILMGCFS